MEIISETKKVIARKEHRCNWCGGIIKKGDVYETETLKTDYIYTWKSHIKCNQLVDKLDMNQGGCVDSSEFHDYIYDAHNDIIDDEVFDSEEYVEPEFSDMVDFVYDKLCSEVKN